MLISRNREKRECFCSSTCFSIKIGKYDEGWGLIFDIYTCNNCGLKYTLARCPCGCSESFSPIRKEDMLKTGLPNIKQGFMNTFFYIYDTKQTNNGE